MLASFDPIGDRKFWLEVKLKTMKFAPQEFSREAQPTYLHTLVNTSVDAFLLGLADHVRPILKSTIRWIKSHDEPDLREYSKERHHWRYGWDSRFAWYQTLGPLQVAQPRRDAAAIRLCQGDEGRRQMHWEYAIKERYRHQTMARSKQPVDRAYGATALAANYPGMGLKLFAAIGVARLIRTRGSGTPVRPMGLVKHLVRRRQTGCGASSSSGRRDVAQRPYLPSFLLECRSDPNPRSG